MQGHCEAPVTYKCPTGPIFEFTLSGTTCARTTLVGGVKDELHLHLFAAAIACSELDGQF